MFELELSRITQMLVERYGLRVLSGPFAGMRYVPQAVGSALVPKLIGSYESELHPTLQDLMSQQFDRVVNIGCGEGYYAVGIARQIPEVPVYAFDSDPDAQQLCAELARLNGVADRVTIAGACTPECLGPLVGPQTLLVCDCEGAEIDLLRPDRLPGLKQCEILVELHDCYDSSVSPAITERFSSTHSITWIDATERDPGMFDTLIAAIDASAPSSGAVPLLSALSESDRLLALAEFRPPGMRWAYLAPARKCASAGVPSPRAGEAVPVPRRSTESVSNLDLTISACILARNEERRIEEALRSLQPWTSQIIVIDNESEDDTVAIARRYTDHILTAPRAANFDAVRNRAIEVATGEWVFYLDADERVPPRLGQALVQLVRDRGHEFEALCIPFKHYFCGKWMEHSGWWPGYTRPQLLKKGRFRYNERLHSGVAVDGRTFYFPAEDPDLAIIHYSYDNLDHYLEKLNRYTHGEAENLLADGGIHSWQAMLAHFVHDWQAYYERGRADLDGMHGFVLAFMSAFYRFASRAKLWDLRRQRRELPGPDPVPGSLREMLEFMAQVAQRGAEPWLAGPKAPGVPAPGRVPLLWRAPMLDPSGFADESRNFVLGLIEAGEPVALAPERWATRMPESLQRPAP